MLKRGRKFHGYKLHVATDGNGMIKKAVTTTAKDADIKQLDHLIEDEKRYITADSANMSKANRQKFRQKGSSTVSSNTG